MEAAAGSDLVATKLTAPTLPAQLINRPRLNTVLDAAVADPAGRRDILVQIHELQPESRRLLVYASFYSAMASDWPHALKLADQFLQVPGREEPLRLGLQLLATIVLLHSGEEVTLVMKPAPFSAFGSAR